MRTSPTPMVGFCLVWVCSGLLHTAIATVSLCSARLCPENTVSLKMSVTSGSYSLPAHPFFQDYPWAFLGGCDMLVPLNIEDSSPSSPAHWPVEGLCKRWLCPLLQEASLMIERYTALSIAMTLGVSVVLCLFSKILVVSSPLGPTFLGLVNSYVWILCHNWIKYFICTLFGFHVVPPPLQFLLYFSPFLFSLFPGINPMVKESLLNVILLLLRDKVLLYCLGWTQTPGIKYLLASS